MIEQQIDIQTEDGAVTTFIVHPDRDGPHPVILFYMDAPAIREELRDMARRLATSGYYVVLPNLYYRSGVMELGPLPRNADDPARQRMMELMASLTIPMIMRDTKALIDFVNTQDVASKGPMGTVGYCMSGQFAINAAASFPDLFGAAASMYGTFLVTDRENSPHLMARQAKGELYFGCAETDHWAPMATVEALTRSLAEDGIDAEVELYPGVEHGFAFPQRAAYNKEAAERHWERLNALFARQLG